MNLKHRKEITMKTEFAAALLVVLLVISPGTTCYSAAVPGECINPAACYQCHEQDAIKDADLGCDRGRWSPTAPINIPRDLATKTVLRDGQVLVTGGAILPDFTTVKSAEIFNPETLSFTLLSSTLSEPKWSHEALTLADGRVLIAGGRNAQSPAAPGARVLDSADLFDPQTNTFAPTGPMQVARRDPSLVLLDDGRVLVTGGGSGVSISTTMGLDSAEIYDPKTGTFRLLSSKMSSLRIFHHAIKLMDGRVLVAGGSKGPGFNNALKTADVFDPETETFTPTGEMHNSRLVPAAVLLRDGRVVFSGSFTNEPYRIGNEAEIYDPGAGTFARIEKAFFHGQGDQYPVRLLDGTAMFPGGVNTRSQIATTVYLYQPESNDFTTTDSVLFARKSCKTVVLPDGRPVLIGGFDFRKIVGIGEVYTPSVVSQAKGLQNVIADTPAAAFRLGILKNMMAYWAGLAASLIEEENYGLASAITKNMILKRVDSCSGGSAVFDWIKDCDEQVKVYAPARLLVRTLNQLTGEIKPPVLSASADVTSGGNPLEVHFTGIASGGTIARYWWDFGDGKSSTEQNPAHTYQCPGSYEATFGVVDDNGNGTHTAAITIKVDYPAGKTTSYSCDLLPFYKAMVCTQCHNQNADSKAGLDLSSYEGLMRGGKNGPVVIPGDPDNSVLVQITGPPRNHAADVGAKPYPKEMWDRQRAWVAEGALDN
jgi:hypothetical protein